MAKKNNNNDSAKDRWDIMGHQNPEPEDTHAGIGNPGLPSLSEEQKIEQKIRQTARTIVSNMSLDTFLSNNSSAKAEFDKSIQRTVSSTINDRQAQWISQRNGWSNLAVEILDYTRETRPTFYQRQLMVKNPTDHDIEDAIEVGGFLEFSNTSIGIGPLRDAIRAHLLSRKYRISNAIKRQLKFRRAVIVITAYICGFAYLIAAMVFSEKNDEIRSLGEKSLEHVRRTTAALYREAAIKRTQQQEEEKEKKAKQDEEDRIKKWNTSPVSLPGDLLGKWLNEWMDKRRSSKLAIQYITEVDTTKKVISDNVVITFENIPNILVPKEINGGILSPNNDYLKKEPSKTASSTLGGSGGKTGEVDASIHVPVEPNLSNVPLPEKTTEELSK